MSMRERSHEGWEGPPGAGMMAPGQGDLRERGERFLAHGADAIERALSRDSAVFLRANRQEGGQ